MSLQSDNLKRVYEEIYTVANRCGRDPDSIQLIAVSKTHPPGGCRRSRPLWSIYFWRK